MKIYTIFDDFDEKAVKTITDAGGELTVHPYGIPRPDSIQMKSILEEYDCVIIGTTQKITEEMFENISAPRLIATASVGLDHIKIPEEKKNLVTVINTPCANAQSVAEYTMGCALSCCKRLTEGNMLYRQGKNNKNLFRKPEDLSGKIMGVIGAGNISVRIMEYARFFGMEVLCWTKTPENHKDLEEKGVKFASLDEIAGTADVISVNLPNNSGTQGIISVGIVEKMKETAIFISVSRLETIDIDALFKKARKNKSFYVCLDLDVDEGIVRKIPDQPNVMITPHTAGGTVETRKRMFRELAEKIAETLSDEER